MRIFFFLAVLAALFVVRYVVLEPLLKVLKATLQNYGRLYILDVRAITWGTRCFPDYSLYIVFFIFFVMDELKSAHLFRLADFYFIVIFSWRLSSFFLGDYRHFFLEIIVVETLPFNTPSNRLGLLTLISLAAA